jgi:hypothetical protein
MSEYAGLDVVADQAGDLVREVALAGLQATG